MNRGKSALRTGRVRVAVEGADLHVIGPSRRRYIVRCATLDERGDVARTYPLLWIDPDEQSPDCFVVIHYHGGGLADPGHYATPYAALYTAAGLAALAGGS